MKSGENWLKSREKWGKVANIDEKVGKSGGKWEKVGKVGKVGKSWKK